MFGAVLVGAEVAGEAGERDGVAELAAALDVELHAVLAAAFTNRRGTRIALPSVAPTTSAL